MRTVFWCLCIIALVPPAHAADTLPKALLGSWQTNLEACAEQASETKLTIEPKSVLFYEHGYDIRRVVKLKDGSYRASGFAVDDQGKVRGSVTLKLLDPDKLQINGGEPYLRCKGK